MIKGFFKMIVILIVLLGTLYYVYEKYGNKTDNYFHKQWEKVFNDEIKDLLKPNDAYSDSISAFVDKFMKKYKNEKSDELDEKFTKLKNLLKSYSPKKILDSTDFSAVKRIFEKN